jgi:hypothetical protein
MNTPKERTFRVGFNTVKLSLSRCFKEDMPRLKQTVSENKPVFNCNGTLSLVLIKKDTVTGEVGNFVVRISKVRRGKKRSSLLSTQQFDTIMTLIEDLNLRYINVKVN